MSNDHMKLTRVLCSMSGADFARNRDNDTEIQLEEQGKRHYKPYLFSRALPRTQHGIHGRIRQKKIIVFEVWPSIQKEGKSMIWHVVWSLNNRWVEETMRSRAHTASELLELRKTFKEEVKEPFATWLWGSSGTSGWVGPVWVLWGRRNWET